MKVYLPSWNGDMRLTAKPGVENTSVLSLTKPTPQELLVVGAFVRVAEQKKWWRGISPKKGEPYQGAMEIVLDAPIAKASHELIALARPKDRTLTAVKFSGGNIEVIEGLTSEALAKVEKTVERAKAAEDPKKEAAAASVKRPTPSCPQCMPGAVGPASEVLLSFLTPDQHEQWAKERAIVVEGHLSGHRYIVAHRHSAIAQKVGRICFDADDGGVVHFHDWSVPPEEEVLAAKLVLEHTEPWLRNEATCLGGNRWTDVYKNPFGDIRDGTESAAFAEGVGAGLAQALGIDLRRK